jgi:hypothetical protein
LKRLNSETSSVLVMACDMNKQFGTDDCGLFALAYALAICMDKNPAQLQFEQQVIKEVLLEIQLEVPHQMS